MFTGIIVISGQSNLSCLFSSLIKASGLEDSNAKQSYKSLSRYVLHIIGSLQQFMSPIYLVFNTNLLPKKQWDWLLLQNKHYVQYRLFTFAR